MSKSCSFNFPIWKVTGSVLVFLFDWLLECFTVNDAEFSSSESAPLTTKVKVERITNCCYAVVLPYKLCPFAKALWHCICKQAFILSKALSHKCPRPLAKLFVYRYVKVASANKREAIVLLPPICNRGYVQQMSVCCKTCYITSGSGLFKCFFKFGPVIFKLASNELPKIIITNANNKTPTIKTTSKFCSPNENILTTEPLHVSDSFISVVNKSIKQVIKLLINRRVTCLVRNWTESGK